MTDLAISVGDGERVYGPLVQIAQTIPFRATTAHETGLPLRHKRSTI